MALFPPLMAKALENGRSKDGSTQGFIIAEKNIRNNPSLKLLCAIARRWSGPEQAALEEFDCRYVTGRNAVSQVVKQVLTYLPPTQQAGLLNELINWVAERVAESGVTEQWFTREFLSLVGSKAQILARNQGKQSAQEQGDQGQASGAKSPMLKALKTEKNVVDMTGIAAQPLQITGVPVQIPAPKSAEQQVLFPTITPRAKPGQQYIYRDRSAGFYKNTYNAAAEPQAILADAQQQLVHGERYFLLERDAENPIRPSTYEQKVRLTAHVRGGELNVPFHERQLSAPNLRRDILRDYQMATDMSQPGVYQKLNEQDKERQQQVTFQREIDRQVNNSVKAYADGRAQAKTYYQQLRETMRHGGSGARHMLDIQPGQQLQYFGGQNTQRPNIHDVDEEFLPEDQMDITVRDQLLDRDEDYTGLGVEQLKVLVHRAIEDQYLVDQGEDEPEGEAPEADSDINAGQAKQRQKQEQISKEEQLILLHKQAGYVHRQLATEQLLQKVSVPQFDHRVKPQSAPQNKQELGMSQADTIKMQGIRKQQYLLQGGRFTTDPRVAQSIEVAAGLFSNEDLGLKSDSDGDIEDSAPSDDAPIADLQGQAASTEELSDQQKPEDEQKQQKKQPPKMDVDLSQNLVRRSEQTLELKQQLDKMAGMTVEPSEEQLLLKQMQQNKAKVIKKEQQEFEKAEAERMRELKKKAQAQEDGKKKKQPKPKVFKSKAEKQMAPTMTGAPKHVENQVEKERQDMEVLKEQKQQAKYFAEELDKIYKEDLEVEEKFLENINKQQRQTQAFGTLAIAGAQAGKDRVVMSQQVKQTVGNAMMFGGKLTDDHEKAASLMQLSTQIPQDVQMPFIYGQPVAAQVVQAKQMEAIEVTRADQDQLQASKTYLPVQPATKLPNASRPEWLNLSRQNQAISVRKLDDLQPVADTQQLFNKVEMASVRQQKPIVAPEHLRAQARVDPTLVEENVFTQKTVSLPQEDKNPADVDQKVAGRFVGAATSGVPDVVPSVNPLLLYQKKKREQALVQQLAEVGVTVQETQYDIVNKPDIDIFRALQPGNGAGQDRFQRELKKKKKSKKGKKGKKGKK